MANCSTGLEYHNLILTSHDILWEVIRSSPCVNLTVNMVEKNPSILTLILTVALWLESWAWPVPVSITRKWI